MISNQNIRDMFLGFTLGDALGVPYEFQKRNIMAKNPASIMAGFGTYRQPKGTWSDDSSLALCLADSLCSRYDLVDMARFFVAWSKSEKWTARGQVFDIGMHTRQSIYRLKNLLERDLSEITLLKYETDEDTNGNGSLMRILPLLFYIKGKDIQEQYEIVRDVSALTHGHIRSVLSCLIYLKFAEYIVSGHSLRESYTHTQKTILDFFDSIDLSEYERKKFERILNNDISILPESKIYSEGYVIYTLEASFWCLLNSSSYRECVFKAINLGEDTDTTATVVGGVAGMHFGLDDVPKEWFDELARYDEIVKLSETYYNKLVRK